MRKNYFFCKMSLNPSILRLQYTKLVQDGAIIVETGMQIPVSNRFSILNKKSEETYNFF